MLNYPVTVHEAGLYIPCFNKPGLETVIVSLHVKTFVISPTNSSVHVKVFEQFVAFFIPLFGTFSFASNLQMLHSTFRAYVVN